MLTAGQIQVIHDRDLSFKTSRSGGKGGQNVNKVESKVQVEFNIMASLALNSAQKEILLKKNSRHIVNGVVLFSCESERSQLQNKEKAIRKLIAFLNAQLKSRKKRLATKASKSSLLEKRRQKEKLKQKKQLRRRINDD